MSKDKDPNDKKPQHEPPVHIDLEQRAREKEEMRKKAEEMRKKMGNITPIIHTETRGLKSVNELNFEEQQTELIRCATDPIYFIENYLTIFDQTQEGGGKIVPFKLFPFQKRLIEDYVNNTFIITNKYRQAGITTTTCAYISWYIMFHENRSVALVADKLDTARDEIMYDVVNFINDCPSWLRPKTGKEAAKDKNKFKDTQRLKRYDNGSEVAAFSSSGLRGYTPTLIFWDETAWTEKGDKFWTSAQPTLQTGGGAIMVSTPNGLDPVFYKTFEGAKMNDNEFKAIELWWFNDNRYNENLTWIKNKDTKKEITLKDENWSDERRIKMYHEGWYPTSPWFERQIKNANNDMRKIAQEILCSFLGSGNNFIDEKHLQRIEEEEIQTPIRQEHHDSNMWIFEDVIPETEYLMVIDPCSGHGDDNGTINILKLDELVEERKITKNKKTKIVKVRKNRFEQVGEYYGKLTPQQLGEVAYHFGVRYNYAYCVVDVTGGYGGQVIEKLFDLGYENVHYSEVQHKPTRDQLNGYIKKGEKTLGDGRVVEVDLIPGFYIGNNRPSVLLEMQRTVNLKEIIIRSKRSLEEFKTFVTVPGNRVADHQRSFHDDSIMGIACGIYVVNFDKIRYQDNNIKPETLVDSFITSADVEERELKEKNAKKIQERYNKKSPKSNQKRDINTMRHVDPNDPHVVYNWLFSGIKKPHN